MGISSLREEMPTDREFSVRFQNNSIGLGLQPLIAEPPVGLPEPGPGQLPPEFALLNLTPPRLELGFQLVVHIGKSRIVT